MKKFLFVPFVLASILLPSAALASPPVSFEASADVCLIKGPAPVTEAAPPGGLPPVLVGEELAGAITTASLGWPELLDAGVLVTIDHETVLVDFVERTFSARVSGHLTVTIDGDPISGTHSGSVTGKFLDPTDIIGSIVSSEASIRWQLNDDDVQARGSAEAKFSTGVGETLECPSGDGAPFGGTLTLKGTVRTG